MTIWSAEIKELVKLYGSFRGQLPELEKELGRLIKADDENMVLLYSRRCLEVIIIDLCGRELERERGTEPLKGIIDKLNKEKKIPAHIIASMHGLNEISTFGTHPRDFDPEQVKPVLINLSIILKWYLKYNDIEIRTETEEKYQDREEPAVDVKKEVRFEEQKQTVGLSKNKLISSVIIVVLVIITAWFAYPKIFKRNTLERLISSGEQISVAVMPFQNMTNDTSWNIWQEGIQLNLMTSLSDNPDVLKVRQIESVNRLLENQNIRNYSSLSPSQITSISRKLDASVLVYGNINQSGSLLRINAQIIDPGKKEVIKSFQMDGLENEIIRLIDTISLRIENFLLISKIGKDYNPYSKSINYEGSTEAFRYYMIGRKAFQNENYTSARDWFYQALSLDTNYIDAIFSIALSFGNEDSIKLAKKWFIKLYEKRDQMSIFQKLGFNAEYSWFFETPYESIKAYKELINYDDQYEKGYFMLGVTYLMVEQYENAIPEFERSLSISARKKLKPFWIYNYTYFGECCHKLGKFNKEKKLYRKASHDFPDNPELVSRQAILKLSEGKTKDGEILITKYRTLLMNGKISEAEISKKLADIYSTGNDQDKAEYYYRQSAALAPENPELINSLAYFLIDKDRNVNEGLELAEKILLINPDNYKYLHTKGWGLYKLARYQEALDILAKSWEYRKEKSIYDHQAYLHLGEAKKAVANQ